MRHDSEIYISIRISSLGENGRFRGLDKISAERRFLGFYEVEGCLRQDSESKRSRHLGDLALTSLAE
jgi:hypothetical protein